MLIELVYQKML